LILDALIPQINYSGSFIDQLRAVTSDYGIVFFINNENIYFTNIGQGFRHQLIKVISKKTGMIGYPIVMPAFFQAKMYFNPLYLPGYELYLDTEYTPLCNMPAGKGINPPGNNMKYQIWQRNNMLQTNGDDWLSIVTINAFLRGDTEKQLDPENT